MPGWALLRTLRPQQWVKNLFAFAPLVFAHRLTEAGALGRAGGAVLIFCLLSGAVYAINDVLDAESDRAHPIKRRRPVASGALPVPLASAAAFGLIAASLTGAGFLGVGFAVTASGYLLLNLAYSLRLKKVPFLDVLSIALGYVLRVLGGSQAISVRASTYLLVCTFLLTLFVALGKRLHELRSSGDAAQRQRAVLASYSEASLRRALFVAGLATAIAYAAYTLDPRTRATFGTSWLPLTIPFTLFGLWRFIRILATRPDVESPTEQMLRDPFFMGNLVAWGAAILAIIYWT